ncbi:TetR/AcrR family transcriptional regulator [Actinomycetospora lemnae]|uniref:TetR/AcrR family transcriptional regulator n=1 Tax=Actinomycetospora lemnae TaxID=3019891 RepID=A0ABT5T137_9PSEU|nr:TetR/AcrR family transcriptional regulator [Actinomycetospora sp. DW7H6]MDD7968739.1 TetR/AcrR family transcriptional regulator [Actinomycetospora sp. DW7H6]
MPRPSQRDRILDAYTDLVVRSGPETVTLDAVAAAAGVSKGGLLYHFGSKEALLDGLLDRARELNDADLATARTAPEGIARYYLRTSVTDPAGDSPVFRALVALVKLAATEPRAADATRRCFAVWREAMAEELGDPLTADIVAVVGDGMYLRAIVGDTSEGLTGALEEVLRRAGPR